MAKALDASQEVTRLKMQPTDQFELFVPDPKWETDDEHTESALFEWSYVRRCVFEQCLRKYYYQYFGSSSRLARGDPLKQKLRFLRALSTRHLRTGDILHFIIRTFLQKTREGDVWSLERLRNWASDTFRRDIEYSCGFQPGQEPAVGPRAPVLLMEFYYSMEDAEELCRDAETKLLTAISNFITSDEFAAFRVGANDPRALLEKPVRLREKHLATRGKIDLAYPSNDRFAVVDWKIGSSGGAEDSLQLLSYSMFAIKEFECRPDLIDLYRVHLADNKVSAFKVQARGIQRAAARIIQDSQRMESLQPYGDDAQVEAFTPCGQPRICCLCPYQEICPKT